MFIGEGSPALGRFRRQWPHRPPDEPWRASRAGNAGRAASNVGPDSVDDAPPEQDESRERPESIRDAQRRRRSAERLHADIQALLAAPDDEEDDEEDETPPAGPPPAQVFVVFRGAEWDDPDGALCESDSIAGVYASEAAARRAVSLLKREAAAREDAWYQPYPVQA
jgi:hypothetical protein